MAVNGKAPFAVVNLFSLEWDFSSGDNDSFAELVAPEQFPPFWFFPLPGGLKIILTAAVFGFMLKTRPEVTDDSFTSAVTACGKKVVGYLAKLFFLGMAVNAYVQDAVRIRDWGLLYLPLVILLSPNYVGAKAIWGKLAKQSPTAALGVPADYRTLAFLGPMAFPLCPGEATWLSVLEHIYALVLLPYQCAEYVILRCSYAGILMLGFAALLPELGAAIWLTCLLVALIPWSLGAGALWVWHRVQPAAEWQFVSTMWGWVSASATELGVYTIMFGKGFAAYLYMALAGLVFATLTNYVLVALYAMQQMGRAHGLQAANTAFAELPGPEGRMCRLFCVSPRASGYETFREEEGAAQQDMLREERGAPRQGEDEKPSISRIAWIIIGVYDTAWEAIGIPKPIALREAEKDALMKLNSPKSHPSCADLEAESGAHGHDLGSFKARLVLSDLRGIVQSILLSQLGLVMLYHCILRVRDVGFNSDCIQNLVDCALLTVSERHIRSYVQTLVEAGQGLFEAGQGFIDAGQRGGYSAFINQIWGGL